ncbi:MAG: diguanylate cyclase [Leptolyngbya sp. SIO1D8]|nr:diguanylate cyclase [Leptolyngbya sp. SIO1D8]
MAIRLSEEVTAHIEKHVHNYTNTPALFIEVNHAAIQSGVLDPTDHPKMTRYFWEQTQVSEAVPYVYYGNKQGDFIGVWKQSDELTTSRIRDTSTAPNREVHKLNDQGQPVQLLTTTAYDPRTRPWYQVAIAAGKAIWSPIYVFAGPPSLGITCTIPIYDASNSLMGVLGADITLTKLSEFLKQIEISDSGQVFIIERSGDIVASSYHEKPFILTETGEERLAALDSQNYLIREATQQVLQRFKSFEAIATPQRFSIRVEGQRQFIEVTPLNSQAGIDWLMLVVIPEADFTKYIRANNRMTLLLCLAAMITATSLGVVTSQWMAGPMRRLSLASKSLADQMTSTEFINDQRPQKVEGSYIRELGTLATAFNQMAMYLNLAFGNLAQMNAELEQRVIERTQAMEKANQQLERFIRLDDLTQIANRRRFTEYLEATWRLQLRSQKPLSLILCDVDYFKAYNDTYGHLAGDNCLQQIAQALITVTHRSADLVARYGGEEFTVVLPQTDLAGAQKVAEKLRQQVKELKIPHQTSEIADVITVSVGVSCCLVSQLFSIKLLLEKTDQALYEAKAKGRDRVVARSLC